MRPDTAHSTRALRRLVTAAATVGAALPALACDGAVEPDPITRSAPVTSARDGAPEVGGGSVGVREGAPGIATDATVARPRPLPLAVPATRSVVIVSQDDLFEVAEAWADYRRGQGFEVAVRRASDIAPKGDIASAESAVRAELAALRDARGPEARLFLLLLGDAAAGAIPGHIPAATCPNATSWDAGCWTDHGYGDLDRDGRPDVATGRVPAQTPDEARAVLTKVQDFEARYTVGAHNRRVSLYIGESGFGPAVDTLLESLMLRALDEVSHDFDIVGAWDNPSSSYWYTPFEDKVLDLYNEGALMTVYVGHGSQTWSQGLDIAQVDRIACQARRPLSLFFACHAGAYVGDDDSLAEALLFRPDASIASYGASDVSHPFGNALLAYESQRVALGMEHRTIGEVIVALERSLLDHHDDFRDVLSGAAMIEASTATIVQQDRLLAEHVALYNLLGDPATSMQYPRGRVVDLTVDRSDPSGAVVVGGRVEGLLDGAAVVSIETPRDGIPGELVDIDPTAPDPDAVAHNWRTSNDKAVARRIVKVVDGHLTTVLAPERPLGAGVSYVVKVYAWDAERDAVGSRRMR